MTNKIFNEKVCWIIAGIFAGVAIIGHTLVLVMTLLGY